MVHETEPFTVNLSEEEESKIEQLKDAVAGVVDVRDRRWSRVDGHEDGSLNQDKANYYFFN